MVDNSLSYFFQLLGLHSNEIDLCQLLATKPHLTVLQIARTLKLPRTSVYRKLDYLTQSGLLEETINQYHTTYQLVSINKLEQLIQKKTDESQKLQKLFPDIQNLLSDLDHQAKGLNQIFYYRGKEAVTRLAWSTLQTKDLLRAYSSHPYTELVGLKEANSFKKAWAESKITAREIYSDEYLKSVSQNPEFDTGDWHGWQDRYIPSSVLDVQLTMDIFDNNIIVYNWHDGEIYGMQIINSRLATFQKQLFDLAWPLTKLKPF